MIRSYSMEDENSAKHFSIALDLPGNNRQEAQIYFWHIKLPKGILQERVEHFRTHARPHGIKKQHLLKNIIRQGILHPSASTINIKLCLFINIWESFSRKHGHTTYIAKRFKVAVEAWSAKMFFTRMSHISTVIFDRVEMNTISIPEFSL